MAITRRLPLRDDDVEEYDIQFARNTDAADMRGCYFQNDTSDDTSVLISRDSGDHMTWADGKVPITRKLVDLLIEGGTIDSIGTTESYTYSGSNVSEILTQITAGPVNLRRITFTYIGNKVDTEVVKVYATNGTTVIGQVTRTYTYSGNNVTSVAATRDV